jgi:hypothetical protein
MMQEDAGKTKSFWLWPWVLGAVLLSYPLNTFFIDDGPPSMTEMVRLIRWIASYKYALIYVTLFVSVAIIHRIRYRTSKPSSLVIALLAALMLFILKNNELSMSLPLLISGARNSFLSIG